MSVPVSHSVARRVAAGRTYLGLRVFQTRDCCRRAVDDLLLRAERVLVRRVQGAPERPTVSGGRHWTRVVLNREADRLLQSLGPAELSAVEISGDSHRLRQPWRKYETLDYPGFDLCNPPDEHGQFDLVICEQVLEHVPDPIRAVQTLYSLCRPGGHVFVSTPFLIRIHPYPGDYWRFTEDGLARLLGQARFEIVECASWGNAACVRANLRVWALHRPWRSLRNDATLPVAVWALARRPV